MKTIYKSTISIIISIAFGGTCFSQNTKDSLLDKSGIYLSVGDFLNGKLTHLIDCTKEKEKIKMHEFFSKPYIDFIYEGEKHTYKKGDIFGVRDCNNIVYRFYENKEYQIIEVKNICIYKREHIIFSAYQDLSPHS